MLFLNTGVSKRNKYLSLPKLDEYAIHCENHFGVLYFLKNLYNRIRKKNITKFVLGEIAMLFDDEEFSFGMAKGEDAFFEEFSFC
jgi:hypothetical protein